MCGILTKQEIEEVRMFYREAKDPQKQIAILCELYDVDRSTVLSALGIPVPVKNKSATASHAYEMKAVYEIWGSIRALADYIGYPKHLVRRLLRGEKDLNCSEAGRRILSEMEKHGY